MNGKQYQVEVVWNREFDFCPYGPVHHTKNAANKFKEAALNLSDGEAVKKARVVEV